jgi:hypothetical protein
MALSKLQKAGIKTMTRGMVEALGDSPAEKEVKEYWYELNAEKIAAEDAPSLTNLGRLDEFAKTPRDTGSDLVRQTVGKPPMFGKDKWADKMAGVPLVYGALVQAHSALFKPGSYENLGSVFVISTDPKNQRNISYLRGVAAKISEMKDPTNPVPDDMDYIITRLRKDQGYFCGQVGASTAGDGSTWCGTFTFEKQSSLPTGRIPDDRIVPFLLVDQPKTNVNLALRLIPKEFYS